MKRNLVIGFLALTSIAALAACTSTNRSDSPGVAANGHAETRAPANQVRSKQEVIAEIARIEADETACANSEDGQSQMGMNMCSGSAADALDALLNEVYTQKMSTLSAAGKIALRKEERAWIVQKTHAVNNAGAGGGSIAPLEENEMLSKLTKTRIMNLLR